MEDVLFVEDGEALVDPFMNSSNTRRSPVQNPFSQKANSVSGLVIAEVKE